MDGPAGGLVGHGQVVDGVAEHVEHAPERFLADGNGDGLTRIDGGHAAGEAVGRVHGQGAHPVVADVLLDLDDEVGAVAAVDAEGVVDGGQLVGRELDVDHGADDLDDASLGGSGSDHDGAPSEVAQDLERKRSRRSASSGPAPGLVRRSKARPSA